MTERVDKDSLPLNQPRRTPSHPTKSHIVKTKVDGKEKIIRFGEQGASTAGKPKAGESDRMKAKRASFKSRHAANIAKGPASAAYWADKVKWADGGSVRTHYAEGDSVRVQPQNATLGRIADFLKQTYAPQRTQQMQGVMELLGVPATARTLERMSYGQPVTNVSKANVPMLPDDTAEAAMAVAPLGGPLAKYAKRVGTNLVQTAPYVARDIVESATSPLRSYAVKPKGGNWAPPIGSMDSVKASLSPLKRNPDVLSGDMINQAAGEDLWSHMVDINAYQHPTSWLRENRPDVLNKLMGEEKGAVNKWLDTKLEKYVRNEMGTPDDPIRLAHEEGFTHIPGNQAEEFGSWLPEDTAKARLKAGYPEEGFAVRKHAEAGYPEAMEANTRKAELWETLADNEITQSPAGAYQEQFRMARDFPDLVSNRKSALQMAERNPWLEKLDRNTPVYKIDSSIPMSENLGFNHMADEIENMLDPESGLPAALRLTPQQLDKVSVKQMVEKVDAVNKWRAEEASRSELEGMMGNLSAKARVEIPEAQLSFVKEPGMKWVDIPETVGDEGKKLCTTIGKQGGWCTQGEGLAKSYGSGDNRLTALIDAEGRPHAQAKITTTKADAAATDLGDMLSEDEAIADQLFMNAGTLLKQRGFDMVDGERLAADELAELVGMGAENKLSAEAQKLLPEIWAEAEAMLPKLALPKPDITELKPPGNTFSSERAREYAKRDPEYQAKVTESVLKFLNSGEWGHVNDLHHYNIVDLQNPDIVKRALKDVLDYDLPHERMDKFNYATNFNPDAPRFMSESQFRSFVEPNAGETKGYAEGGRVRAGEGLPDPTLGNLTLYADTVSREMFPNARDNTKRDAARHMLASALAAQKTNPTIAGWLGKAHELKEAPLRTAGHWLGLSEPRSDYPTDIHNNELGIQLGTDNRTLQDLIDSVEREAQRGTPTTQKGRASLQPDAVKSTRYAQGGMVGTPVTAYDPFQVDQIMSSINAPQNYSHGGSVSAYDPSRIDAIVNQFM
jgi:hypothetical protein